MHGDRLAPRLEPVEVQRPHRGEHRRGPLAGLRERLPALVGVAHDARAPRRHVGHRPALRASLHLDAAVGGHAPSVPGSAGRGRAPCRDAPRRRRRHRGGRSRRERPRRQGRAPGGRPAPGRAGRRARRGGVPLGRPAAAADRRRLGVDPRAAAAGRRAVADRGRGRRGLRRGRRGVRRRLVAASAVRLLAACSPAPPRRSRSSCRACSWASCARAPRRA